MALKRSTTIALVALITGGLLLWFLFFTSPTIIGAGIAFFAFFILALIYPRFFFLILCVVYPFRYLQFEIEDYNYQIEYITVLAVIVLLATLINVYLLKRLRPRYELKFGLAFAGFVAACGLSLLNTPDLVESALYIVKPVLLFYLAYLLLPINLIKAKDFLQKVLWAVLWCGIATSLLGLISIIQQLLDGVSIFAIRATPFAYGIFNPLGYNQNQIGEVLVATIPFALILYIWLRKQYHSSANLVLGFAIFMTVILLLTLSRAGWIALAIEVFIVLYAYRRSIAQKTIPVFIIIIILLGILVPSSVIFYQFITGTEEVSNSNEVRWVLTDIALDNYEKYPIFGEGIGTYVESIYTNYKYLPYFRLELKFDAHGLFQKLVSEVGTVGMITFGIFVASIAVFIQRAWKHVKGRQEAVLIYSLSIAAIVGTSIYVAFNTSYYDSVTWLPIGIAIATIALLTKLDKTNATN
ncbi:O-antigen ligase family protein [Patescibacteria group bacterium]